MLNERASEHVERIAFVGTPCQISGLRAIQKFPWERRETLAHKVVLAIGLFCTRSFDPKKLISYISNDKFSLTEQRRELDLLEKLDRLQGSREAVRDPQLEAAIQSMEVAYRMQTEAPDVFDIRKENKATLDLYGPGSTARGCLMAVRLVTCNPYPAAKIRGPFMAPRLIKSRMARSAYSCATNVLKRCACLLRHNDSNSRWASWRITAAGASYNSRDFIPTKRFSTWSMRPMPFLPPISCAMAMLVRASSVGSRLNF